MSSKQSLTMHEQDTLRKINFDNLMCQNAMQEHMDDSEAFMRCSTTLYSRMSIDKGDNKMENLRVGTKDGKANEKYSF